MAVKKTPGSNAQRKKAGQQNRPALTRALGLLEAVASKGKPASLNEIAGMQDVPMATAFRLCQRLEESGYLARDSGSRRYTVGARLMRLSLDVVRASGPSTARHQILTKIVEAIGETCNLTTLVGNEVMYLDRVETRWPLRLNLEPGSRVPIHATASGKLLLAHMSPAQQRRTLDTVELTANTPATMTDPKSLMRELQKIKKIGYSTDNEEFLTGLIAVAVPIRDSKGTTIAGLACHAPIARLSLQQSIALVPLLTDAADRLSRTFED